MIVARQLLIDAIIGPKEAKMGEAELSHILEEMIPLVQNQRYVESICQAPSLASNHFKLLSCL